MPIFSNHFQDSRTPATLRYDARVPAFVLTISQRNDEGEFVETATLIGSRRFALNLSSIRYGWRTFAVGAPAPILVPYPEPYPARPADAGSLRNGEPARWQRILVVQVSVDDQPLRTQLEISGNDQRTAGVIEGLLANHSGWLVVRCDGADLDPSGAPTPRLTVLGAPQAPSAPTPTPPHTPERPPELSAAVRRLLITTPQPDAA